MIKMPRRQNSSLPFQNRIVRSFARVCLQQWRRHHMTWHLSIKRHCWRGRINRLHLLAKNSSWLSRSSQFKSNPWLSVCCLFTFLQAAQPLTRLDRSIDEKTISQYLHCTLQYSVEQKNSCQFHRWYTCSARFLHFIPSIQYMQRFNISAVI